MIVPILLSFLLLPISALPLEPPQFQVVPDIDIPSNQITDAPEIPYEERDSPTHGYAVDIAFHTSFSDLQCLRAKGYRTVFVRAFNPFGNGYFDNEALNTIQAAYSAGLGSEVYITPQPNSTRSGADQLSLTYQSLRDNAINVRSMWIQVTSPSNWPGSMAQRIQFIQDMIQRGRNLNLAIGIYTSFYDWLEITGGWNTLPSDVILWYWHVLGMGAGGETEPTLEDFRPFGPWKNAVIKQFAMVEKTCGMVVNRDVYSTVGMVQAVKLEQKKVEKLAQIGESKIRVGGIGF